MIPIHILLCIPVATVAILPLVMGSLMTAGGTAPRPQVPDRRMTLAALRPSVQVMA